MKSLLPFLFCCSLFASKCQPQLDPHEVLNYWLGPYEMRVCEPMTHAKIWFQGGEAVDNEIREKFGKAVDEAIHSRYHWECTPRGRLALIILLDQFSRNIHRNSPEAFAADSLALYLARQAVLCGEDKQLLPVERMFLYMPFQHSEHLGDQATSLGLYKQLCCECDEAFHPHAKMCYEYARRHYEIIKRFGRFPHRNAILSRTSTLEEEAFLKEPNSSF